MKNIVAGVIAAAAAALPTHAEIVSVNIVGNVIFNGITAPPLGTVTSGQTVTMSFNVDSNVFVDGIPGDTRGYEIIQSSYALSFSGGVSVGLANPFPGGQTPYFTLVDGFPVSDGFFVSTSPSGPGGVPLDQAPFQANAKLGYGGSTLSSLNILDALGTYDFTGLTSFSYTIWAFGPDNIAMEIDFKYMTIEAVPAPAAVSLLGLVGLIARRRRN